MDRNRESRRASIVGSNGFNRRRHRTNSVRDSPDEDGGLELTESVRLRERVKKDRDRERERERDRERERERERDLRERSSRSKRRRAERLASNRDDIGGDETSDESLNDDEDDEYEENVTSTSGGVRMSPVGGSVTNHHIHVGNHNHHSHSSSFSQQQNNSNSTSNIVCNSSHHLQHRKTFPPSSSSSSKVLRAPPAWKSGDEMISVSVPRKARSVSTKRSHDWISSTSNNNSSAGLSAGADQNPAQLSGSPGRPTLGAASAAPPEAAPQSPSSSNASIRKELKHSTGPKLKPLKVSTSSSKPSSSNPEELEIEIAEVLYGLMTQSQGTTSSKEESKEVNRLSVNAKLHNSSPICNYYSSNNNNLIPGPNSAPLSAVAPKRKRPRQVPESSNLGARTKTEADQTPKNEIISPNVEKMSGSESASEAVGGNPVISQGQASEKRVPTVQVSVTSDLEMSDAEVFRESRDLVAKKDVNSSKEQESAAVRAHDTSNRDSPSVATVSSAADTPINASLPISDVGNQKEEKFEIDLMAPPPQVRSSSKREIKIDLSTSAVVDQKPLLLNLDRDIKQVELSKDNEIDKGGSIRGNARPMNMAVEEKKSNESETNKAIENKGHDIDLRLDLEKQESDIVSSSIDAKENRSQLQTQKQLQLQAPPKAAIIEESPSEKPGYSTGSLPLPISMTSWPGGLPPMGYMAPLQGVVSMDGSSVAPAHMQPLFSQPRPKRCATHCHIARNIHCLQQFMKMNPFWPAPAGSPASLFGSKPGNVNVAPPGDISIAARGVSNSKDKGQGLAAAPNNLGKDKSSQPASSSDSAQRKQPILLQQALPPVAPSNLLAPAFIFPVNQQLTAAARPPAPAGKSPSTMPAPNAATTSSTTASSSAPPAAMSFSYPNMSPNETTQYLAILQNNAYPFPIPTVGAPPPNYRGVPPQAMPLFNGPFYSSQIIHHQQQLQQSQQQLPPNQPPQSAQAHNNASAPNNSSTSSGRHLQQRPPQGGGSPGLPNSFSSQKSHPPHNNQYMHGGEDGPQANDNRGSRAPVNIYGQNFALPIHPQNFALMTHPPATLGAVSSNQNEKKSHQQTQQQQQGLKSGVETLPPHTFAMSFGPMSGNPAGPGIDRASMVQNPAMFQNFPEGARQSAKMMAVAAQAAQKSFRISEEGKSGNVNSSSKEDERKTFTFSRMTDMADGPGTSSSVQGNNVIDGSSPSMNIVPGSARASRSATTNGMAPAMNVPNAHIQAQLHQQMLQLKQQQQMAAANAVNRAKVPVTNNGSIYSEHLTSSAMAGPKFQNAISPFPPNLIQSNSPSTSPSQSPQWKNSARTSTSLAQGLSSLGPSGVSMHKNTSQQHSRTQPPMHTQISFGGNQKQSVSSQGQQAAPSNSNQVGSPTTSSISKGATSGSPRTTSSASTNNKPGHGSSFSAQQPKNSPSMPTQKSPSILGNPHTAKNQVQQQSQPKTMQQAQLFFSSPYPQSQPHHSTGSVNLGVASPSGYYVTQRRPDQQQRDPGGTPLTSSSGVLSLCTPISLSNTNTNDPATAIAAATSNAKGGVLQSQGMIHGSPFGAPSSGMVPAGFSYVHPFPAGVKVKPAEQKQPAGNDNLHPWQPEKK